MTGPGLPNRQNNVRLTLWQRLWSSPWTWLIMAILFVGEASVATTTVGRVFLWVFAVLSWLYFFNYADKRWGQRP